MAGRLSKTVKTGKSACPKLGRCRYTKGMPQFAISLLGGFRVQRDGQPIARFHTEKTRALFAYLALHPDTPHSRPFLAGLLWPESPEKRAAHSLRQSLSFLRKIFGSAPAAPDAPLDISRQSVTFRPGPTCTVDALALEEALAQPAPESLPPVPGELLAGLFLPDAPEFELWLLQRRESLRSQLLAAQENLADRLLAQGNFSTAQRVLTQTLALEPWHEAAHRGLMRAFALQGNRSAALAQFERCRQVLAEELGAEPLPATHQLYRQIQQNDPRLLPAPPRLPQASPQPPFAGRAQEHAQLAQLLARLRGPAPVHLALLRGDPGVGKTRLAEEFLRFAASQGAAVLAGRCYEFSETVAYQPLVTALTSAQKKLAELAELADIWRGELARLLPQLATIEPAIPPADGSGPAARQRLFQAVFHGLQALGSPSQPLVVFLDDLQWADSASLDLLHYLLRQTGPTPVLFLGTFRPGEVPPAHPLTNLRRSLSRDKLSAQIHLDPLSADALRAIADRLFGPAGAQAIARHLQQESEGNPFVLSELLAAWHENGYLRPPGAEDSPWQLAADALAQPTALSASVQDMILQRVERLPPAGQEALRLAAVIGRTFAPPLLQASSAQPPQDHLPQWLAQRLIRPAPDGDGYDFAHDKIREVLYRQLDPPRRKALHGQIAAGLLGLHPGRPDAVAPALAHHFFHSAQPQKALPFLLLAGQQAERMLAFEQAAQLCAQALSLKSGDIAQRFQLLALRQRAFQFLGRSQEEGADAAEMLRLAEAEGTPAQQATAYERLALFQARQGQVAAARAAIARAVALARQSGDALVQVKTLVPMAMLIRDAPDGIEQALDLLDYALAQARESGDLRGEAMALGHQAIVFEEQGRYAAALAHFQQSLALLRRAEDFANQANCLFSLAGTLREMGRLDPADAALAEALALCQEWELPSLQVPILIGQGRVALYRQDADPARARFQQALALAQEFGRRALEGQAELGLGQAARLADAPGTALAHLHRALALFADGEERMRVLALAEAALAELAQGRPEQADELSAQALAALQADSRTFVNAQAVYFSRYRVLYAAGDAAGAAGALAQARSVLHAHSSEMSPQDRQNFLQNVPVNRAIVQAGDAQAGDAQG